MFEHTVVSDLDQLICLHSNTDDELEALLKAFRRARPDLWISKCETFKQSAYFFLDSQNHFIGRLAKRLVRVIEQADTFIQIINDTNGELSGIELRKPDSSQYVLLLADVSHAGKVRAQYYDNTGFYGHSIRDNYKSLLK